MKEFLPEIDELIAKELTQEATSEEKKQLQAWLKESAEHQNYFDELSRIWSSSGEIFMDSKTADSVNTDVAWHKVKTHIRRPKHLYVSWLNSTNGLKIAAAIAVLVIAIVFYNRDNAPPQYNYVAETKVKVDTLTDGSVITLNKKSSLSTLFSKKERRVRMTGEAFFAVAPNKEKPFVIEVQNIEIKVVGTAFNVDNISKQGKIIVTVQEGIVEVQGKNETLRLEKGHKAIYDTESHIFEKTDNIDKKILEYKKETLEFDGNTLKDIVNQINKFYAQNIEIASPAIENCTIKTTFDGQDAEFFFRDVIGDLIKIQVERQGDKLILRGSGCE